MTTTINASPSNGLVQSADGSGILKVQSNGVTTNALAWVNFNGIPSTPTIRASYNVSSVVKNSTGEYKVNYTTSTTDANYSVSGLAMFSTSANAHVVCYGDGSGAAGTLPTTSSFVVRTIYFGLGSVIPQDCTYVTLSVFGN